VVSLIGANGAGKTTFLNMVTGYLKPDSGRIVFDGRDIVGLSPRQITKLGVSRSFQIPQLFQTLNVHDNLLLAESIAQADDPQAATDAVLERFALRAYAAQPAGLLPEGIRKLLDVAMALSSRSRLLLLDEPTSGVSADEKFAIMDVVMGAARAAGVTVIFVEHDMDIVARYAAARGRVLRRRHHRRRTAGGRAAHGGRAALRDRRGDPCCGLTVCPYRSVRSRSCAP
jgi:branched-chain amino acid transport system ATP-binding protein